MSLTHSRTDVQQRNMQSGEWSALMSLAAACLLDADSNTSRTLASSCARMARRSGVGKLPMGMLLPVRRDYAVLSVRILKSRKILLDNTYRVVTKFARNETKRWSRYSVIHNRHSHITVIVTCDERRKSS